jgi:DNA-binding beta-propeller fold protein YncE
MPLVPLGPPVAVPIYSGFDYVTVDALHRRVYAAHTGSRALLIVDADDGSVKGQVRAGSLHGVAFNPSTGIVYAGSDGGEVLEIDPQALKVLRRVDVPGPVDAIAYDASRNRIYADEDDGTRLFVIDAATMNLTATVKLPGHKPEYLALDPQTHAVYQNIDDLSEIAVVDPNALTVSKIIPTPGIAHNHPLQYDASYEQIVTGGGGVLAAYDRAGKELGRTTIPAVDQCDLDGNTHIVACAGGGFITVLQTRRDAAPAMLAQLSVPRGLHTLAIDAKTGTVWGVW